MNIQIRDIDIKIEENLITINNSTYDKKDFRLCVKLAKRNILGEEDCPQHLQCGRVSIRQSKEGWTIISNEYTNSEILFLNNILELDNVYFVSDKLNLNSKHYGYVVNDKLYIIDSVSKTTDIIIITTDNLVRSKTSQTLEKSKITSTYKVLGIEDLDNE